MIEPKSQILITNDFEKLQEELKERIDPANLYIIADSEIKVEHAKEAIKQAYITSKDTKSIAILGESYNIYAQNALLKILEEPPKNVVFFLVSKSKSTFLPTILSRLPIVRLKDKNRDTQIELERFDLEKLYDLAKNARSYSKIEAKAIIKAMLNYAIKNDFALSGDELEYFDRAIKLLELNSNPANVFITAGLILLTHKKRKR